MFHVGQLVVCVKQVRDCVRVDGANYPVKGTVYTVREIRDDGRRDGALSVLVEGIDNSHFIGRQVGDGYGYKEPGFPEHGFGPLDDDRIAIFRQMLVKPPKELIEP